MAGRAHTHTARRGRAPAPVRLWLSGPQEEQEARTQEGAPVPVPPAGRPAAVPVATDRDGRAQAQGRLHGGREAGGRITIGAAMRRMGDATVYQSPYATVAYPISAVEYGYTGEPEDLDYGQEALAFFKANP